ncbi:hypothetical protein B484DRAFT_436415, partial [Ochromonadaceae sp. CCMP2298]
HPRPRRRSATVGEVERGVTFEENTSLYVCHTSDAAVAFIWDTAVPQPTSGLTFQVYPRRPTEADFDWTHEPPAARVISVHEAELTEYVETSPKVMDSGASTTVCSKPFALAVGAPTFKRPRLRAGMVNDSSEMGDEFCVFIVAMRGVDAEGRDVVQEFGIQALIMKDVANDLLIGDSTLAFMRAALYVAENTMTLFCGAFQASTTKWRLYMERACGAGDTPGAHAYFRTQRRRHPIQRTLGDLMSSMRGGPGSPTAEMSDALIGSIASERRRLRYHDFANTITLFRSRCHDQAVTIKLSQLRCHDTITLSQSR